MHKFLWLAIASWISSGVLLSSSFAQTIDKLPNGVRLTLSTGETVQLRVCTDRIVHVTAQPKGAPRHPGKLRH